MPASARAQARKRINRLLFTAQLILAIVLSGCSTTRDHTPRAAEPVVDSGPVELVAHFVDVGQGDCTLIVFPSGKRLLVDLGSEGEFPGAETVRKYLLKHLDPTHPVIDALVITHPDTDHYNQLMAVIGPAEAPHIAVRRIMFVGAPSEYGATKAWLETMAAEKIMVTDGSYTCYPARPLPGFENEGVSVLAADVRDGNDKNVRSIVLKISYRDFDLMLPGDATSKTDQAIISLYPGASGAFLDVEVLKAAHHGAWATATKSERWVQLVKPELIIFSASETNRFGHPHLRLAELLAPYTQPVPDHGILLFTGARQRATEDVERPYRSEAMYLTAKSGTIVVRSDGQRWSTTVERD